MDFFDVLRKGCTFGGTKKSKKVAFGKPEEQPERRSTTSSLDFFSLGAPEEIKEPKKVKTPRPSLPKKRSEKGQAEEAVESLSPEEKEKQRQQTREMVAALRRKHRIHASPGTPDPVASFDAMPQSGVPAWLVRNLKSLGFSQPTPIQMQCFPAIMSGSHVLASAPTGSGKTIAFLGPILACLGKPGKDFARALIVDPSRELAKQTLDEFTKLTVGRKWNGRLVDRMSGETAGNIRRLDVAVCTPLRLVQMLRENRISLDATKHLVFDEADKLLDLGFAPQIDEMLTFCPKADGGLMQTMMFSATLPPVVVDLAGSILTFLAVAERPDEDKPLGRLITRKVPMAPAPGDYFYFGATIGPKFGQKGTPALEEEGVEREEGEAVPAIMDRGLDLGLVAQERQLPEALQVVSRDGASTSANLILTGGTGSVHAEASSESHSVLDRVIAQAVTESVAEVRGGGSAEATSKSLARAIGSATATAVANAVVTVNIDGQGEAHAIAEADAEAIAKVVAQAIAKATALAVGVNLYARGVGRARVSETRLAKAIARASAEASTKGGEAEASSTVVADAVVDVVAEAMATALSSVADHVANAETKAEAMVDATDEQVFVDTADDAFVTGESKASGQGSGNAETSVLPDKPEEKKSSTIPIRPQAESKPPPQKKTSTLTIRPQAPPAESHTASRPAASRPSGKKTSVLPIGPQSPPKQTSSFEFRPQPAGWPTQPPKTGFEEGKEQRPPKKYSSTLPIGPRPVGYPAKPGSAGNRPVMKNTSNVQIGPQGTEWPTGWSSSRPTGEGRFQSHRPSTTFKSSGQRPSHTGIRITSQSGPETKVVYTSTGSPGRTQFSGAGYTVKTSSSYFSRQRGGQLLSPRSLPDDPVVEILDLQEADSSFKLTEKLCDALGVDALNALREYNVFRASLGESSLVDSDGAEPWAIALVLEMFEIKLMDRKSDWEQPAFKAADVLASLAGEENFNAILSAARMYLIRLIRANEAF